MAGDRKIGDGRGTEFRETDLFRRVGFGTDIDPGEVSARFRNGMPEVVAPKARRLASARQASRATRV